MQPSRYGFHDFPAIQWTLARRLPSKDGACLMPACPVVLPRWAKRKMAVARRTSE